MHESAGMIELRKRMLKYVRTNIDTVCSEEYWQEKITAIINKCPDDPMQYMEDHQTLLVRDAMAMHYGVIKTNA